MMQIKRSVGVLCCVMGLLGGVLADLPYVARNYTYLYFENGFPTAFKGRRAAALANVMARENPDLVIQTGFYSLRLECDTMKLSGYNAVRGAIPYEEALKQPVSAFTPAKLVLRMVKDGVNYTCTHAHFQTKSEQFVRLIESGQFVQRFDHRGLVFKGENGRVLENVGRLEVVAWCDRVVFQLDCSGMDGVTKTGVQIISPKGQRHQSVQDENRAFLTLQPHLDQVCAPLEAVDRWVSASALKANKPLHVSFDKLEQGVKIDVPLSPVHYPKDKDHLDEFWVEVKNPTDQAQLVPLIFNELRPQQITGTCMVLCEADGRPTGHPVQISKNWHKQAPALYEGIWIRGYTSLPLAAGEQKKLRLRVVYGYWGGVPAVSHAQLCLIGWGGVGNWKWDQSALGSWGETMCFDFSQHLGGAFITDVRPTFTLGKKEGKKRDHEWTENVGGGDYLVYYDAKGTFHWGKQLKTAYGWTGPSMTKVRYSGVTDDDKIRFTYTVRSGATGDYNRRFLAYRYEFLKAVTDPDRLSFVELAADLYNTVDFERWYYGDQTGLLKEIAKPAEAGLSEASYPFNDHWLVSNDILCDDKQRGDTLARRGMLALSSSLNGNPFPLQVHVRGRAVRGKPVRSIFEIGPEGLDRSFAAGDVVEGEIEFMMPPKSAELYWGPDEAFRERLKGYETPWQAVFDEFQYNVKLEPHVLQGTVLQVYPLEVKAASGSVLAEVVFSQGGIGHVPVILRDVPTGQRLLVETWQDGKWISSQPAAAETFYQGGRTSATTQDYALTLHRPAGPVSAPWRFRVRRSK